jgi:hypothetical protein
VMSVEVGEARKWRMHVRSELFSVGKFVIHRCDPCICGETNNEDMDNGDLLSL